MSLTASDRTALSEGARALSVELEELQLDALTRYVSLLLAWNAKVNLTAVTEPRAIVDKHLLDSLALVPFVEGTRVLDVGTGPGLPSVVLAIARSSVEITAFESIQKKVSFVRAVARELQLPITVEAVRLEQRKAEPIFDFVVSRATFEPAEWVTRGAPFVRPGGTLVAMLSAQQAAAAAPAGFTELPGASNVIGGAVRRIVRYRKD